MKIYLVGGAVRDEIMGVQSKDLDYTVVLDAYVGNDPFGYMVAKLKYMGFKIFVETPKHVTVRAQFPKGDERGKGGMTADFVLARQEGPYSDGRRPDWTKPGTLMDDLARRDFTVNAIAKAEDGTIIDPFNGVMDIRMLSLRAVGDPMDRLTEDALRAVRALRFSVTKGFRIDPALAEAMESYPVWQAVTDKISDERIDVELRKMFAYDTVESLRALSKYPALTAAMFSGSVSLTSTMKKQKKG